jgi:hypothetical protein
MPLRLNRLQQDACDDEIAPQAHNFSIKRIMPILHIKRSVVSAKSLMRAIRMIGMIKKKALGGTPRAYCALFVQLLEINNPSRRRHGQELVSLVLLQ